MKLFLIRHCESEADLNNVIECNADFNLTEKGCRQAESLAGGLEIYAPFNIIYSSPLIRAKKTAEIIASKYNLTLIVDHRLSERNVGLMAGMPRDEAEIKFPLPPGGLMPHHKMGAGTGESMLEMEFRIKEFLSEIEEKHSSEKVIAVAHGGIISCGLINLLKVQNNAVFGSSDTAVHYIEIKSGKIIIHFLNRSLWRKVL